MKLSPRAMQLVLLGMTGAVLGTSTNLAKVAGDAGLPPLAFLAWSITGAALVLCVIAVVRGQVPSLNRRTLEYFIVAAFVTVAGSHLIFVSAVPHVGAPFVALAIAFPPLLTYLGALALGIERYSTLRAGGVVLALAGAALLAMYQFSAPNAPAFWIALTMFGPVLLAVGNLYRTLRWPVGESADTLAPGMLIAAALMLLAAGVHPAFTLALPSGKVPLILVGVQTLLYAGQFLLLFALQKAGGPVLLSLLGSVAAVIGIPMAVVFLNEQTPQGLIYAAPMIAAGVSLVTWGGAREQGR